MAKVGDGTGHKCCGQVEKTIIRSQEKQQERKEKPSPWVSLKMTIGMALGIIGYAFYVYIGRLCVPMIKHNRGAIGGGRRTGIAFLVVFCLLGLMMLWTYGMVVFIGPGKARDFTEECDPPPFREPIQPWSDSTTEIDAGPYVPVAGSQAVSPNTGHGSVRTIGGSTTPSVNSPDKSTQDQGSGESPMGALTPSHVGHSARSEQPPQASGHAMMHTRKPPTTPFLLPEYRYCSRDRFVKPMRAHHCRACGTCILKYDHHCPWIGQCVGAHNHKFFMHFLQWACIFCIWTGSTLVANVAKAGPDPDESVDVQQIVIVALSFLFALFTITLQATHIRLLVMNWTTVESLNASYIKEREERVLSRLHLWYQFRAKRETRKKWDDEWGRIGMEGNLWWLGSARKNWEAVMGDKVYQWFLPIGRTPGDGLTYPTNPRFDQQGRWRRRSEWPAELR